MGMQEVTNLESKLVSTEGQADAVHRELRKIKELHAAELAKLQEECEQELHKVKLLHIQEMQEAARELEKAKTELADMRTLMETDAKLAQKEGCGKDDADNESQGGHGNEGSEIAPEHKQARMGMPAMAYSP